MAGDLMVFDQTMAHGLCRPSDHGQSVAESFAGGSDCTQIFLSGELPLTNVDWEALGSPWLAVETHHQAGALDLMTAEFDDRSGAIKSLRAMMNCMLRSSSDVDGMETVGRKTPV